MRSLQTQLCLHKPGRCKTVPTPPRKGTKAKLVRRNRRGWAFSRKVWTRRTRRQGRWTRPETGSAIHGIWENDFENAYGPVFRSQALKEASHQAPRTAAMAATQWSAGANRFWCREGAARRRLWTEGGGWQGARSAQLLFAMSLEEAVDNTPVMAEPGATRVGQQDDMFAVAQPAKLKVMLEHLQIALQACGHRLRMHKCKVWFSCWDDTPDDGLPQEALALLQLIQRELGGLVLSGNRSRADLVRAIHNEPLPCPPSSAWSHRWAASTWSRPRRIRRILHGLEAVEAAHLWDQADDEVRTVMLGSGGQGDGSLWIAPTRSARDLLPDAHFTILMALRAGL